MSKQRDMGAGDIYFEPIQFQLNMFEVFAINLAQFDGMQALKCIFSCSEYGITGVLKFSPCVCSACALCARIQRICGALHTRYAVSRIDTISRDSSLRTRTKLICFNRVK